jgi:hypothetical protein
MVLLLAGETPVLVAAPGTILARGGGISIQVPVVTLDPNAEVVLGDEAEVGDLGELPKVQVRLEPSS